MGLPSSAPPVSAAPTWPKNFRRLEALTVSLPDGFAVSFTFAAPVFSFIVVSLLPEDGHCVTYALHRPVNYKRTLSMLRSRWLLLCKNCYRHPAADLSWLRLSFRTPR